MILATIFCFFPPHFFISLILHFKTSIYTFKFLNGTTFFAQGAGLWGYRLPGHDWQVIEVMMTSFLLPNRGWQRQQKQTLFWSKSDITITAVTWSWPRPHVKLANFLNWSWFENWKQRGRKIKNENSSGYKWTSFFTW